MDVTRTPLALRIVPILLATMPLPTPLITPPITNMYFIFWYSTQSALTSENINVQQPECEPMPNVMAACRILDVYHTLTHGVALV